jgi:hypothetical protein
MAFYEKVKKVKADVAAFLISCFYEKVDLRSRMALN